MGTKHSCDTFEVRLLDVIPGLNATMDGRAKRTSDIRKDAWTIAYSLEEYLLSPHARFSVIDVAQAV